MPVVGVLNGSSAAETADTLAEWRLALAVDCPTLVPFSWQDCP